VGSGPGSHRSRRAALALALFAAAAVVARAETKPPRSRACTKTKVAWPAEIVATGSCVPAPQLGFRDYVETQVDVAPFKVLRIGAERIETEPASEIPATGPGFRFRFDFESGAAWQASCAVREFPWLALGDDSETGVSERHPDGVECALAPPGGAAPSRLVLDFAFRSTDPGRLAERVVADGAEGALWVAGDAPVRVVALYELSSWPKRPGSVTGYLFSRGGRWLAAVSLWTDRSMFFHPDATADERDALTVAAAALTLAKPFYDRAWEEFALRGGK
jgi:hypothetical protein